MFPTQDQFIYTQNQINSLAPFNQIFNPEKIIDPLIEDDSSLDNKIYYRNEQLDYIEINAQENNMSLEEEDKSDNQEINQNENFTEFISGLR